MKDQRIDIMQEFVDLYQHEEMLAFFEFSIAPRGAAAVSGLCKISKPKGHDTALRYLSLTFMADTPDEASTATMEAALDRLAHDAFKAALPSVVEVVPLPQMTGGSESYLRQFDVMLEEHIDPGQPFVMDRLLPALCNVAGLQARPLVWWDAAGDAPQAADEAAAALGGLRSHVKRLVGNEPT